MTTCCVQNVIVIGGGLGGLCLALELQARGVTVKLYEAATEISPELGSGFRYKSLYTSASFFLGGGERGEEESGVSVSNNMQY